MNEDFLQYIWKNDLFDKNRIKDTEGNKIKIIDSGQHNLDAGPDFFNAKIKIDDTIWAGNVEIHLKSSNWEKHNHHIDKAYDNVILHIVNEHNKDCFNTKSEKVTTAIFKYDENLITKYQQLSGSENDISCQDFISNIDPFTLNSWFSNILIERIEQKTDYLKSVLKYTNNNWEESFYFILAKAFGFKVNAMPFELLAKSLPSLILAKNKSDKFQIEALLFGQAGMLSNSDCIDPYFISLKREYNFLAKKYNLKTIDQFLWKFLRIRPVNFPTLRISQFADLIYKSSHLFSKVIEIKDVKLLYKLFELKTNEYWDTHYTFGKESKRKTKIFGKHAADNIIINTVIPILFLYGKEKDNEELMTRTLDFLEQLKAENNRIIKKWLSIGLEVKNAYFSQSLLQLYNEYCLKKRCLECRIGMKYMNQ